MSTPEELRAEAEMEKHYASIAPKPSTPADELEYNVIVAVFGQCGRIISASKSSYTGKAVFNANLCTDERKLWYGDVDLNKDRKKLQKIADVLQRTIYVLRERDARFENENAPLLANAVAVIKKAKGESDYEFFANDGDR